MAVKKKAGQRQVTIRDREEMKHDLELKPVNSQDERIMTKDTDQIMQDFEQ